MLILWLQNLRIALLIFAELLIWIRAVSIREVRRSIRRTVAPAEAPPQCADRAGSFVIAVRAAQTRFDAMRPDSGSEIQPTAVSMITIRNTGGGYISGYHPK